MAPTSKDAGSGPAPLPQHQLVEALRPDPGQAPPDAVALQGFLGDSTDPGSKRLYLTPALDEYVEIPVADILHTDRGTGGAMDTVWVPRSLTLTHHQTASQQVQAQFLSGSITGAHLAAGAPAVGGVVQPTPTVQISVHVICPTPTAHPSLPVCPTETCLPSRLTPCVSHFSGCPSLPVCPSETCLPSRLAPCVSHFSGCPSLPLCPTETCPPSRFVCTAIPQGAGPVTQVTTAATVCLPHTAIGPCGGTTVATVCTQPAVCLPHTAIGPCGGTTVATVCTQPAVCLPHTAPPVCPITVTVHTVPPVCPVPIHTLPAVCFVTTPAACFPHTLPAVCTPISGGFACPVSVGGCPSGPACQPGTITPGTIAQGPGGVGG